MIYRYAYLYSNNETSKGKFLSKLLHRFSGLTTGTDKEVQKIKIAIIGAGRVGASFAEESQTNCTIGNFLKEKETEKNCLINMTSLL